MALISVVVPVYYNEGSLPLLLQRLDAVARAHPAHAFEFIFVDDGSGDGSLAVLKALAKEDRRVCVLRLSRNFGSNAAILAGLAESSGDCAAFIAADLQDPPESLHEMIAQWERGAEVVLAVRRDRNADPWLTRLSADLFNWLFKKLVFDDYSPQGIGFFLIDRRVVDVLVRCSEKNSHLMALILWAGFNRAVVEYDRAERIHGKSRWTLSKKVKYFIDAFAAFSYLPIRVASGMGILLSILGAAYAVLVLILRLLGQIAIEGWTALMIVLLLVSGAQLLILGIIGEYLWRSLDAARARPLYIVASITRANLKPEWQEGQDLVREKA